MKVGEICQRNVVTAVPTTGVTEIARIMLQKHVGSVVIIESETDARPVGIVTDRDIVLQVLAENLDPGETRACDIMTSEVVTTYLSTGVLETMRHMRSNGVRRIPVVDQNQKLVGILALDDLIDVIVSELGELSNTISSGQYKEKLHRRAAVEMA